MASLFCDLRPSLLRYIHSFGLPLADGEDIVQEVFLALFRHLREGKPRDNLRGWIFRVARNLALKRRWRNGREPVNAPDKPGEEPLIDPGPNPEERAAIEGANRRVLSAIKALPERDRNCLFLRAEGMRYREIAEALEISLGGVAAALSRAVGKLAGAYRR